MTRTTESTGTFVPAVLREVAPELDAQALRETARLLLRVADRLDGKRSRVTFVGPPEGICALCGERVTGDTCPNCGIGARQ